MSASLLVAQDASLGILEAILLGIVEGITEYLPVSSTGHLILAQRALGIPASEAANAFAIAIQAGAIAAVLFVYRERVASMVRGVLGKDEGGRRIVLSVFLAFLPAAIVGLLFNDAIEGYLFGLKPVVAAWFVGGVVILVLAARGTGRGATGKALDQITPRMALWIGLAQCLALWPGTSRSLVTILGGVLVGFELVAAVEFSFLLGVVTLGAATAYKTLDSGEAMLDAYGMPTLLVGFVAATISAALAVKWLVAYLSRHDMKVFGYYRIALAVVVAVLMGAGVLS